GMQSLTLPLRFPAAGRYRIVLDQKDLGAGGAHLSLHPQHRVVMDVIAGRPDLSGADAELASMTTVRRAPAAVSPAGVRAKSSSPR
ncbi:MAG: hypothetical protein ACE5IK_11250, partial [Acidobacteriota bacterium]